MSVSVIASVSERITSSFTHTHTETVSGDGDVVIIMRPLITHWSRRENPIVFIKIFPFCSRRSAEALEVLPGPPSPAGLWRPEFGPPPDSEEGLRLPPLNFFTASLFQRGKMWKRSSTGCRKTLLPLEKGGREGFLVKAFQRAKVIRLFNLCSVTPIS